jgi:hypothetical protein
MMGSYIKIDSFFNLRQNLSGIPRSLKNEVEKDHGGWK